MAKSKVLTFQMECKECKSRNYNSTKNPTENKDKVELNKHCPKCRAHTLHKEIKISKAKK